MLKFVPRKEVTSSFKTQNNLPVGKQNLLNPPIQTPLLGMRQSISVDNINVFCNRKNAIYGQDNYHSHTSTDKLYAVFRKLRPRPKTYSKVDVLEGDITAFRKVNGVYC